MPTTICGCFLTIFKKTNCLEFDDFKRFRLINKACRDAADHYLTDVQSKYTFKRRVDAAANRFMDRPLWQKVAIVAFVTLTSPISVPVLLAVKSPKIYAKYRDSHIVPAMKKVADTIEKVSKFVFVNVVEPLVKLASWTNRNVVAPATKSVTAVARATLVPLVEFTVTNIVAPTAKVIKTIANALLITLPLKAIEHVALPLIRHVILPVARVVGIVAKAILVTLPLKVAEHLLLPIVTNIGIPVAKVVATLAKALFVTLPFKVFQTLLFPVGKFLGEVVKVTYSTLLKPAAKLVEFVASKIFLEFVPTAVVAVCSPVSSLVVEVASATVDFGRFLVSKIL